MANILVTGGAGYIGSHTCKYLKSLGYTPISYDNLSRGFKKSVLWGPLIQGDLFDTRSLVETFKKYEIQAVLHFAAFAYVGESTSEPELYFRNNVYGSVMLFEAMKEAGIKNIVFSSTCAVYGESQSEKITENHPRNPTNPYGLSKKIVEDILGKYDFNHCILRYFNGAGADPDLEIGECHDPEPHILPNLIKSGLAKKPISLFGDDYDTPDGTCIRDFIHVTDLAKAHGLALEALLKRSLQHPVYNLGTGKGHSLKELCLNLGNLLNQEIPIDIKPRRPGDPARLVASAERFKQEFHWEPQHSSLPVIFETAIKWIQKLEQEK